MSDNEDYGRDDHFEGDAVFGDEEEFLDQNVEDEENYENQQDQDYENQERGQDESVHQMQTEERDQVAVLSKDRIGKRQAGKAIPASERTTTVYMTKYEKARLLGTRALQLSMNAPPMVELQGETDPLQIAMKELRERKISNIIDIESFHDELLTEIDDTKKELPNYSKSLEKSWDYISK